MIAVDIDELILEIGRLHVEVMVLRRQLAVAIGEAEGNGQPAEPSEVAVPTDEGRRGI